MRIIASLAATCLALVNVVALDCSSDALSALLPSYASVTSVRYLSDGSTFDVPSDNVAYPISPTDLRAVCAVEVLVVSSSTSAYSFGLFLPQDWNGRFLMVGNGGFAGGINWLDMGAGLGYGFAVASTDTGHSSTSGNGTWALNQAEKVIDWGYRAMHGSTDLAKQLVNGYYGRAASFSYYSGCSTGGRQGLKAVQMFPKDFDGVLAGAPAWWTSHLQPWTVKVATYNLPTDAYYHIPAEKFQVIADEVQKQCDPQDGTTDGIISDPTSCNFDPTALLCGSGSISAADCLTSAQVNTVNEIHQAYTEDSNSTFIFPGLSLGSEAQWSALLGEDVPSSLGTEYVQDFLLNDPSWDYENFNYSIVQLADEVDPGNATADQFDLSGFNYVGGKLLMYHGQADGLISTGSSTYFYDQVRETMSAKGNTEFDWWFRFFLVPGMQHCTSTPDGVDAPWYFAGANQAGSLGTSLHSVPGFEDARHDALLALMAWVEQGEAPDEIIATKWNNDTSQDSVSRQRPLCPYPKQAKYTGMGSSNDAVNWSCQ